MKLLNKVFIAVLLLMFLPLTTVYSYDSDSTILDIQLVGLPDNIESEELPEDIQIGPDTTEVPKDDNPPDYDPNNPYAEWEN